jgi:probable phosphoglycerate mutase
MIVAYIDGGARGNPGPAGYGVRIEQSDGTLVEEFCESIGTATNNVAEYRALVAALEWAKRHGHRELHVRSDSLLLVQQMRGNYKVKNPGLQPLYAKARLLTLDIGNVTFEHIGRALNAHADRLANAAMDGAGKSEVGSLKSEARGLKSEPHEVFTALERAVRLYVYDQFVKTTRAPEVATIAVAVNASPDAVISALKRLAERRALVLAPASTNIWMAHPFSAVPTAYPVAIGGRTYWANCAWDAAGVLSLVGGDGDCRTRCADCGQDAAMAVRDGRMVGEGVVHYLVPPRRFWQNVAYT